MIFTTKGEIVQLINAKTKTKQKTQSRIWCIIFCFCFFLHIVHTMLFDAKRASDQQFVCFVFVLISFIFFFFSFTNANIMLLIIVELLLFQLSVWAYICVCVSVCLWYCVVCVLKRTQSQLIIQPIEPSAELLYCHIQIVFCTTWHEMVKPAFNRTNWLCNSGTACWNLKLKYHAMLAKSMLNVNLWRHQTEY